jgi:hypothetical protein
MIFCSNVYIYANENLQSRDLLNSTRFLSVYRGSGICEISNSLSDVYINNMYYFV